jgi:hypothetical protein
LDVFGLECRVFHGPGGFSMGIAELMALLLAFLIGTATFNERFGGACYLTPNQGDLYVGLAAKVRNEHGTNKDRVQR